MNVLEIFQPITTFVFDVDGVLTDGAIWVMPGPVMVRRMNVKDGYAIQLAVKKGYHILVISGGYSLEAEQRLQKLGVKNIFMRVDDKVSVLKEYLDKHSQQQNEVLYMGDDMPDYEAMQFAGLPCCPADAVSDIKRLCKYVSSIRGGEGCVREVIEKVLRLRGDWFVDTLI